MNYEQLHEAWDTEFRTQSCTIRTLSQITGKKELTGSVMTFLGVFINVEEPEKTAAWMSEKLDFPWKNQGSLTVACCGDDRIFLHAASSPLIIQKADEGYYTGLAHIAFVSTDLETSVKLCQAADLPLANHSAISYNPGVWDTGMNYVNPLCPYGFGLEICQRLDLPSAPMTAPARGFEHIGIPVSDIKESIGWYKALGFSCGTCARIHREDGKTILCCMMTGHGIILELFEFTGIRHEPFSGQPLAALLFQSGNKEETKELLAHAGITAAEYPEGLLLKGPDRETLWVQTADPDLIH